MNTVDIALILILFFFGLRGYWKGFFHEMMSLLALLAGCAAAFHWSPGVSQWLGERIQISSILLTFLAFLLIYAPVFLGIRFGRSMIERFWPHIAANSLNGLIGLFFGGFKGAVVVGCAVILLRMGAPAGGAAAAGPEESEGLTAKLTSPVTGFQAKMQESKLAGATADMTMILFSAVIASGENLFDSESGSQITQR